MILTLIGKTSFGRFVIEADVDVDKEIETGESLFSVAEFFFDGETEAEQKEIEGAIDAGKFEVLRN